MRTMIRPGLLALALIGGQAFAASPVGTWTTIDDKTGQPKSVVEITESGGELTGRVLEVLQSDQGPNPVCDKCEGDLKGQPIEGMTILWGLKQDGERWSGGHILDPKSGKVYGARLQPADDGAKLEVRGFKGVSLLGRTQVWERRD